MLNFSRLETRIMNDEGFSAKPYKDTVGVPTIGYGATSILGKGVTLETENIAPSAARQLLRSHLYGALVDAQHIFSRFDEMDGIRQEALVNMAFNLGRSRLSKFRRMIEAAEELDFRQVALEARNSKWFDQVKDRGQRIVHALESGEWA